MIISHKHKFIFLETKKTASTSVSIFLSQYCGKDDVITPDDYEAEEMKKELGQFSRNYQLPFPEYKLKDLKVMIRNFSTKNIRKKYYNHMSAKELRDIIPKRIWNSYFIFCFERNPYEKAVSAYNYHMDINNLNSKGYSFREFLLNHNFYKNYHRYSINGTIAVNVFQYNKLNEEIQRILNMLGIQNESKIPYAKSKKKKRKSYVDYYDAVTKKLVFDNCIDEFNEFSYQFEE